MAEVREEATYVRHHKQKIAFLFSAMRHFAAALEAEGVRVDYVRHDAPDNPGSLGGVLQRAVAHHRPSHVVLTEPGEWRVRQIMEECGRRCPFPSISARTRGSSPAMTISPAGRRAGASTAWSSSIARCAARRGC